jgi:hypothetical protein
MSTRIEDLDPRMQGPVQKYVRRCPEEGIPVAVLETRRELSTHIAYHLRGRAPVAEVRLVFARCGLWPISDMEAQTINTKTLYSKHIEGLAVDIAPTKDGRAWWDAPRELWLRMFAIAEDECGLDACAAGKWNAWQWDWPHCEMRL